MKRLVHRIVIAMTLLTMIVVSKAQTEEINIENVQRATVFISQVRSDDFAVTCVGSGTIVRYDGLILTNAHIVSRSSRCPGDEIIISLTTELGAPPVPRYRAEIEQIDVGRDIALLRISRELDGRVIEPDQLPILPFVDVGDSDLTALDQTLTYVGYPSVNTSPIEVLTGSVSGFIAETSGGDRSWIKVSSTRPLNGTMSGGGAYNRNGQLVGILTSVPASLPTDRSNCQIIEDSNGDGFINNDDICIPIADFVTVMRPYNSARPLIRSGALRLSIETLTTPQFQTGTTTATPEITRSFFAPSVANRLPTTVIGSAPAGTTSLYLFFDYRNMTTDTVYEVRVTVDGVPNEDFSLPPVRWSGATNGLWYVGSTGVPWPNGVYEFRIFINGINAQTNSIIIGGPVQPTESFNDVIFGVQDTQGNFAGNGYVLPTGPIATARFIYRNMQIGTPWTAIWYYNDVRLPEITGTWSQSDGANGVYTLLIQPEGGLQPGNYRVELYINGLLATLGEFVVAGSQAAAIPRIFDNIEFSRAPNPFENPGSVRAENYPDGVNTLYSYFDWERILSGTRWTMQWRVDGDIFYSQTVPWNATESGDDFTTRLLSPGGLPDGTYTLELLIGGNLLASNNVVIGIGQLPIDRLEQAGGIRLRGQIIDSQTNEGIGGASFLLISEDFSIANFVFDQSQLYAQAITDADGFFEIDRALQQDSPYSVMIMAEGYLPITADGYIINEDVIEDEGLLIEMLIPLSRD